MGGRIQAMFATMPSSTAHQGGSYPRFDGDRHQAMGRASGCASARRPDYPTSGDHVQRRAGAGRNARADHQRGCTMQIVKVMNTPEMKERMAAQRRRRIHVDARGIRAKYCKLGFREMADGHQAQWNPRGMVGP